MPEHLTVGEIESAARASLDDVLWDYVSGGSDSEQTLRANRSAFERVAFRGRVLRDVSDASCASSFLGVPMRVPVLLAPVGTVGLFDPEGAVAVARAAASAGTVAFVGVLSSPALSSVAAAVPDAPLVFQLYPRGNREWLTVLLRRAEDAGCVAVCLTADSAVEARRERDLRNRFDFRARHGPPPNLEGIGNDRSHQTRFTWSDLEWLKGATTLPVVLKGVTSTEDAARAVEAGVDAVYVSNHGGRTLDGAPATIDVVAEIAEAVAGRAEIVADSGVVHGVDALKLLASGATAVGIGKLQCLALAAGGAPVLAHALGLLRAEIETAMALLGVSSVADLDAGYLRRATLGE